MVVSDSKQENDLKEELELNFKFLILLVML